MSRYQSAGVANDAILGKYLGKLLENTGKYEKTPGKTSKNNFSVNKSTVPSNTRKKKYVSVKKASNK